MGKKRKAEADVDAERTLQKSFVTAANSISELFTLAVQQNKRSRSEGAVDVLERMIEWLVRDYGSSENVPTGVLLHHLQRELAASEQREAYQSSAQWPQGVTVTPAGPLQTMPGMDSSAVSMFGRPTRPSPAKPNTPFGGWL